MSEQKKLAILVAAERSGTHFVRSVINQNRAGRAFGEVANASVEPEPSDTLNYFAFRRDYLMAHPTLFVPSVKNSEQLINAYLDHCLDIGASVAPPMILDIKYGHLMNFTSGWWDVLSRPLLFDIAKSRGIPIIHLVRRRVFETVISNMYASATGVWRASSAEELQIIQIDIDRDLLIKRARLLRQSINLCRTWIEGNHHAELHYEDLLSVPSPGWSLLGSLTHSHVREIKSFFIKTTPAYETIITNFQDIADLLTLDVDGDLPEAPA
jgi:hypothetical protein